MSHRFFYLDDAVGLLAASLRAVNVAERAGVEPEVAHAYTTIAFAAGLLRAHGLATRWFEKARATAAEVRDRAEVAFAFAVEGVYHAGYARFAQALESIERAEAVLRETEEPVIRELVLVSRGHLEFYMGDVDGARTRFEELLRLARARGSDHHATWALFSIARSHLARERDADALALLEEAREALRLRPELQSEIICHGLLAQAYARVGRDDDAWASVIATRVRIERSRPTGFAALEGYVGALEAILALTRRPGVPGVRLEQWRAETERLVSLLGRFARVFPMANAAHLRFRGELARLRGAKRRAERLFAEALEEATRAGLPRDIAASLHARNRG